MESWSNHEKIGLAIGLASIALLLCLSFVQECISHRREAGNSSSEGAWTSDGESEDDKVRKDFVSEHLPVFRWNKEKVAIAAQNEKECTICMEPFQPGVQISCSVQPNACKHLYHYACIEKWLVDHSDCPTCRSTFLGSRESRAFLADQGNTNASRIEMAFIQAERQARRNRSSRRRYHGPYARNESGSSDHYEESYDTDEGDVHHSDQHYEENISLSLNIDEFDVDDYKPQHSIAGYNTREFDVDHYEGSESRSYNPDVSYDTDEDDVHYTDQRYEENISLSYNRDEFDVDDYNPEYSITNEDESWAC